MNQEMDKESLLIYLNDLRTMEAIIYECQEKTKQIDMEFNDKKKSLSNSIEKKPIEPSLAQIQLGYNWGNPTVIKKGGIFFIILGIFSFLFLLLFTDLRKLMRELML